MRSEADLDYKRYTTEDFKAMQAATLSRREKVLPVLGLTADAHLSWLEMPVKLNLETYAGLEEVSAVSNLEIVHFIKKKNEEVPPEVLSAARGTIVYTLVDGQRLIVRKSIPYTYDILSNKIASEGEQYVFQIPEGSKTRTIKVPLEALKISPYIEGTVIDIMKVDGRVHWFTSRNLLPRGVMHEGKMIYKKSRWVQHHEAFTTSFENVIRLVDPGLLNENDELFPKNCATSNKLYRFILLTRERVRAEMASVSKRDLLVYLGCYTQFEYEDVKNAAKLLGEQHVKEYQPKTVPSIPKDTTRAAIVQFDGNMTIEQANEYLAGAHPELGVLSGGGKLVITASVSSVAGRENLLFHVKSSSYAYREQILAGADNLYKRWLSVIDLGYYDFTERTSTTEFYKDFPAATLPKTEQEVLALMDDVKAEREVHPTLVKTDAVPSRPITHIWYLFLVCANPALREMIMRYPKRYSADIQHLQEYLFKKKTDAGPPSSIKKVTTPGGRVPSSDDERKAERNREFIREFKSEILRHEMYNKGQGLNTVFLLLGTKTERAINIARRDTNSMSSSLVITEPDMMRVR